MIAGKVRARDGLGARMRGGLLMAVNPNASLAINEPRQKVVIVPP
jgi:hypothetical protein